MVDRVGGKPLSTLTYWTAYVNARINNEPTVAINPTVKYDESTRKADVTVSVVGLKPLSGARLQVWLVEDDIVDMQYMGDGSVNKEYVHNHVFRTTVNDKNGDPINVVENADVRKTYSVQLDSKWKAENMSVVAFVFTADGVQQTEKVSVASSKQ